MLQYRHRKFGHVVDVPEPSDILAAADREAAAVAAIGTKDAKKRAEAIGEYAQWHANRQRQTLALMDKARKWERYTPPPAPVVVQRDEPRETSEVEEAAPSARPAKAAPAKAKAE